MARSYFGFQVAPDVTGICSSFSRRGPAGWSGRTAPRTTARRAAPDAPDGRLRGPGADRDRDFGEGTHKEEEHGHQVTVIYGSVFNVAWTKVLGGCSAPSA